MGIIIPFPDSLRFARDHRPVTRNEDATIIILPSVRIERHPEPPSGGSDPTSTDSTPRRRTRRTAR